MCRWRALVVLLAGAVLLCVPVPAGATAPGYNGKIAYSHYAADSPRAVRVINPDGTGDHQLELPFVAEDEPAWSPSGRKIGFRCFPSQGGNSACTANADGSGAQEVAAECCSNFGPTWSADGTDLMWTVLPGGRFSPPGIWRVDADGSDKTFMRQGFSPDWSPDGDEVAYVNEYTAQTNQINVMSADNTSNRRLTDPPGSNDDPSWSPDGTIAFSSTRDGNSEIYIMDAQGNAQTRLTDHPAEDRDPEISPDGTKIVFSSTRAGEQQSQLYVMNIDGTGVTQLTHHAAPSSSEAPDWQALPQGYVRPKSATSMRVSLVPGFDPCTEPNRTHGPPLAFGSCDPPRTSGRYASLGDQSEGRVTLTVKPGTGASAWDVHVSASVSDVTRNFDGADALGSLDLTLTPRITDRANGGLRLFAGTTSEPGYNTNPLHVDLPCTSTSDPGVGSTCAVQTTFAALSGLSGKRAVVGLDQLTIYDGGEDGYVESREDNTPLATQGVFVP